MSVTSCFRQALRDLFDLFIPPACPLCSTLIPPAVFDDFCPECRRQMPPLPTAACRRCAHPYPLTADTDHLCGICLQEATPLFDQVVPGGLYAGTLQEAIHRFKYRGQINLDLPLAMSLLPQLNSRAGTFDLILPVPLHERRLQQRSYNQSLLIARILARTLRVPLEPALLHRQRNTLPQQGQNAADRRRNLRGAFGVNRSLSGERLLLVDDVLTTGATARECARMLKLAGAGHVTVAVLARAPAF